MASRNNTRIASAIGTIHPDQLQTLLADGRYTQAQVAVIAGTTPARLAKLLAEPVPEALPPRNWTSSNAPGVYLPYVGVTPIPYAGPGPVGFTYGAPIAAREDFS